MADTVSELRPPSKENQRTGWPIHLGSSRGGEGRVGSPGRRVRVHPSRAWKGYGEAGGPPRPLGRRRRRRRAGRSGPAAAGGAAGVQAEAARLPHPRAEGLRRRRRASARPQAAASTLLAAGLRHWTRAAGLAPGTYRRATPPPPPPPPSPRSPAPHRHFPTTTSSRTSLSGYGRTGCPYPRCTRRTRSNSGSRGGRSSLSTHRRGVGPGPRSWDVTGAARGATGLCHT